MRYPYRQLYQGLQTLAPACLCKSEGRTRKRSGLPVMAVSVSIVPMTGMHQPYLLLENIDHFTQMFGKDITLRYVGYRVDVLVLVGELDIYTAKKKLRSAPWEHTERHYSTYLL